MIDDLVLVWTCWSVLSDVVADVNDTCCVGRMVELGRWERGLRW